MVYFFFVYVNQLHWCGIAARAWQEIDKLVKKWLKETFPEKNMQAAMADFSFFKCWHTDSLASIVWISDLDQVCWSIPIALLYILTMEHLANMPHNKPNIQYLGFSLLTITPNHRYSIWQEPLTVCYLITYLSSIHY